MNDLIRDALTEIGDNTHPPVPDQLEFLRRVRSARRRRTSQRVAVAAGVAAVVGSVAVITPTFLGNRGERPGDFTSTTTPAPKEVVPQAAWFIQSGRLRAAYDGTVVSPDLGAEQVIGSTSDGVWYVDNGSNVRWLTATVADGVLTAKPAPGPPGYSEPPVRGAVQAATVSDDGRSLAWVTLSEELVVWSVPDRKVTLRQTLTSENRLLGVGDAGALVEQGGALTILGPTEIELPRQEFSGASISGGRIAVREGIAADGETRIYDVADAAVSLVETVPGHSWLAPDGLTLVSLPGEENPSPATVTREGEAPKDLGALAARASSLQFTSAGTVLLTSLRPDTPRLLECVLATATCEANPAGATTAMVKLAISVT